MENHPSAKLKNIIEMAYWSSAMGRIFEKGAAEKIRKEFEKFLPFLELEDLKVPHRDFCLWLMDNVKTARGKQPTFGQAAKVLDFMLKVLVSYCHYPSGEQAEKIAPKLNGVIDNLVLGDLKKKGIFSLAQVDEKIYWELQEELRQKAAKKRMTSIEHDDPYWRELARKEQWL